MYVIVIFKHNDEQTKFVHEPLYAQDELLYQR